MRWPSVAHPVLHFDIKSPTQGRPKGNSYNDSSSEVNYEMFPHRL